MNAEQAWQSVLGQLKLEMPQASFDTWVRDAKPVSYQDGTLTVQVGNAYARDWLENRLAATINRLLIGIMNSTTDVKFVIADSEGKSSIAAFNEATGKSAVSSLTVLTIDGEKAGGLTPRNLSTGVSPFLNAISDIQHIIDEILKQQPHEIQIKEIKQYSPISVSLDGASEAIGLIKDTVVPWRRKHNNGSTSGAGKTGGYRKQEGRNFREASTC